MSSVVQARVCGCVGAGLPWKFIPLDTEVTMVMTVMLLTQRSSGLDLCLLCFLPPLSLSLLDFG